MDEKKKRKLYADSQLVEALEQISQGMSIYQASKNYNIPESTLRDKRQKRYKNPKCGVQPVLTAQEEKQIVDWIHELDRSGVPVGKQQLLEVVSEFVKDLDRPNPFKDGVPGKCWFQNFMKRHPTLKKQKPLKAKKQINLVNKIIIKPMESLMESTSKIEAQPDSGSVNGYILSLPTKRDPPSVGCDFFDSDSDNDK